MRESPGGKYRFEGIELDVQNLLLTVNGEVRSLEPKSFRLLQFLVENRARTVTKEELFTAVWAGTFVTDNALTRAIAQIRKALNDDVKQPRFIETVPTVGYRFLPPVEAVNPAPAALQQPDPLSAVPQIAVPQRQEPPRRALLFRAVAAILLVGALALYLIFRFSGAPASSHSLEMSQFTNGAGLDTCAAFSPDGNMMAYASDRTGSFQVYVRSQEPGARALMLTTSLGQNLYPNFSPDGRVLAFSSIGDPGIYRVPSTGGPVQRLTHFGVQPVWSPDGKWIVFRSDAANTLSTTDLYFPATSTLFLIHAEGGEPQQITGRRIGGGQAFPTWKSDSSEIRFANYITGACEMWAYRLQSKAARKLFRSNQPTGFGSAVFGPGDRSLFYVSSRVNGEIGIWEQPIHPRDLSPSGEPFPLYQPGIGVPRDLALAQDGKHLAFSAVLSDSRLYTLRLEQEAAAGEPEALTTETSFRYLHPSWTSDGKAIAFIAAQKARRPRVQMMDYPAGQPAEVDASPGAQTFLMVSEKNSLFYLSSLPGAEGPALKIFEPPDGVPRAVFQFAFSPRQPSISPDEREIVFGRATGNTDHLWKLQIASGKLRQLTFGENNRGYPRFSHDGRSICYEKFEGNRTNLAVMPADGPESSVDLATGVLYPRSWSPDDSKIAYAGYENGLWNLYWISRITKEKRQLTTNKHARVYLRYPEWSRDGRKMVYEFNESKGNIYLARFR